MSVHVANVALCTVANQKAIDSLAENVLFQDAKLEPKRRYDKCRGCMNPTL